MKLASAAIAALLGAVILAPIQAQPTSAASNVDRVVVEKAKRKLSLFAGDVLIKSYKIALGSNPVGHKQQEGDGRTPEGTYVIDYRNEESRYYLSLHVSYPDADDVQDAAARGVPPGGDIFIHGLAPEHAWLGKLQAQLDWTDGCIALANGEIEELWDAVRDGTAIEIRP